MASGIRIFFKAPQVILLYSRLRTNAKQKDKFLAKKIKKIYVEFVGFVDYRPSNTRLASLLILSQGLLIVHLIK